MILESVLASKLIVFHYQFELDNLNEECLALKNSGLFVEFVGRPTGAKRDRTSGRKASTGGPRFRDLTMSKIKEHAPSLVEYFEYLEKTFSAKVTEVWAMSYIPGKGGYLGFHPDNFWTEFRTSLTLGNNHFGAKKTMSYKEGDSVGTFTTPHGTVVAHNREQGGAVKDWTKEHGTDNTDGTWTIILDGTTITYGGSVVAEGGEFGSTKTEPFGSPSCSDLTDPPTRSPTDAPTSNPTSSPSKSPTAPPTRGQTLNPTKSPTASPSSGPSTPPTSAPTPNQPTTGCSEAEIKIDILTDQYPAETSWTIADECGESPTIVKTSPVYDLASHQHSETYCLPNSRYTFVITDDPYEDGICCGYGDGSYAVYYNGVEEIAGGDFGASDSKTFGSCDDAPGPTPPTNPPPSPPSGGDVVAEFDVSLGVPRCDAIGTSCSSGAWLDGVGGSETDSPNTLDACADGTSGKYHEDESVDAIKVSALGGSPLKAGTVATVEATVWAWEDGSFDTADFYYAADADSPDWTPIGSVRATADGGNGGETKLSVQYVLPDGPLQAVRVSFRYEGSPSECSEGDWDDADDLVFPVAPSDGTAPKVEPEPVLPAKPVSSDHCTTIEDRKRCNAAASVCQWKNGWGKGCFPKE
ncbi:hypothetical protein ACHAWF_006927 [Thalassiosira exigua]